jgi:Zn-finger nucleic acid-binding protein
MLVLEHDEVEIDHCISCGGIWLDAEELTLLLEGSQEKENLLLSFKLDLECKEKRRKCPICRKKMDKVLCGAEEKVLIDKCRNNDGLWFDREELRQIIEMGTMDKDVRVFALLNNLFGDGKGNSLPGHNN